MRSNFLMTMRKETSNLGQRYGLIILIAAVIACASGCEQSGHPRLSPAQVSVSVIRQFDLRKLTPKSGTAVGVSFLSDSFNATTISLAPNEKSAVAIVYGRAAIYFADIHSDVPGRLIECCSSPNSVCIWTQDSTSFVLYDAPDRLWGKLKLVNTSTLAPVAVADCKFVNGSISLPNDMFLLFLESGDQFSAKTPWRPQIFAIKVDSLERLKTTLPTTESPSFGDVIKVEESKVLVSGLSNLEAWSFTWSSTDVEQRFTAIKGRIDGVLWDDAFGHVSQYGFNSKGTQIASLSSAYFPDDSTEAEVVKLQSVAGTIDVGGSVKFVLDDPVCSVPYTLSASQQDELCLLDATNRRLTYLQDDTILAVAVADGLKLYSTVDGSLLTKYASAECNTIARASAGSELLVSSRDGFSLLKINVAQHRTNLN